MTTRIAILGDFSPLYSTHHALNDSIRQIQKHFTADLQFDWVSTDVLSKQSFQDGTYKGLWIAPGSPYKDFDNVLGIIRYCREQGVPSFGNCGGFQHMVLEYARNVIGIKEANHTEIHENTPEPVISKMDCSLVEKSEQLELHGKNSILSSIILRENFIGKYYCNYGFNLAYKNKIFASDLIVTTVNKTGDIRGFELKNHRFFLGTLFQPALTSNWDEPNPIILKFAEVCIGE